MGSGEYRKFMGAPANIAAKLGADVAPLIPNHQRHQLQ
jgi:hypothetical protein